MHDTYIAKVELDCVFGASTGRRMGSGLRALGLLGVGLLSLGCAGEVPETGTDSAIERPAEDASGFDASQRPLDFGGGPDVGAGGQGGVGGAGGQGGAGGEGGQGGQGGEGGQGGGDLDGGQAGAGGDPIDPDVGATDSGVDATADPDPGDDGQADAGIDPQPAAVDCTPLAERNDSELCDSTATTCGGIFTDGVGRAAWCASAGLRCAAVLENFDDRCGGDADRPALDCNTPSQHNSDYCVCAALDCVSTCAAGAGACGDDGCGGSCGRCNPDQVCASGQCEDSVAGRPWENLAAGAIGYGQRTTGGAGGEVCWVSNLNDSGAGSLRHCASRNGPTWVRFQVSGNINLSSMVEVGSDKTLDGRGASIEIRGYGLRLAGVRNVLIHNLRLAQAAGDNLDAIQIVDGTQHVWLDHLTLSRFTDGLVDVTRSATDVTISWCLFREHDKVMLIGASVDDVGDTDIRVTLHHNRFDGTNQRHPRLRYGRVHAFNNHFRRWGSYGMGISQRGQLRAERNIYEAGDNRSAVIHRVGDDPNDGLVRSVTEWRINNADVQQNDRDSVFHPGDVYDFTVEEPNEALRDRIGNGVGWRDVPLP